MVDRGSAAANITGVGSQNVGSLFRLMGGDTGTGGASLSPTDDDDDVGIEVEEADEEGMTLTAKPHAFAGAVLSPKHARDLTPSLCLAIASALSDASNIQAQPHAHHSHHAHHAHHSVQQKRASVPYTLWITEAWRVLGWAEPSAALFWEMATMYHTLYLAGRAFAADYHDYHHSVHNNNVVSSNHNNNNSAIHGGDHRGGGDAVVNNIPPILSCGSASSVGSGTTTHTPVTFDKKKQLSTAASAKELPVWLVGTFLLLHCEEFAYQRNLSGQDERRFFGNNNNNVASLGTVAGGNSTTVTGGKVDFTSLLKHPGLSPRTRLHAGWSNDNSHCTAYLLRHLRKFLLLAAVPHNQDAVNACMHLAALPSMPQQSSTSMSAAASGSRPHHHHHHHHHGSIHRSSATTRYSTDELRRQHEEEHGQVGLNVALTVEDLERLNLMVQPPQGGGIDDAPLKVGEYLWTCIHMVSRPPPMATIALADVERELRRQLELDLFMAGFDKDEKEEQQQAQTTAVTNDEDAATAAMAKLSISSSTSSSDKVGKSDSTATTTDGSSADTASERAKQPSNQYLKELSYTHLRGTTIILKPNPPMVVGPPPPADTPPDSGADSAGSGPGAGTKGGDTGTAASVTGTANIMISSLSSPQRLHDLAISECSDAHFYLLQPFEHATIAACTGCTIVVGAVAGLLHVVDCERTTITAAARRILVSNSSDVTLHIFSPSPPLMVGDNRTCQFAPYNSYYDGFREDLLATGLAAAVVSESASQQHSPYHGSNKNADGTAEKGGGGAGGAASTLMHDAAWPPLQCASNKWKQPVEMAKLEMPQVAAAAAAAAASATTSAPGSPTAANSSTSAAAADDKAPSGTDSAIQGPVIMPASEFSVLFVPIESDAARQRRLDAQAAAQAAAAAAEDGAQVSTAASSDPAGDASVGSSTNSALQQQPPHSMESQYCRLLAEVLQLSPFRLPVEYERRVLVKCERMKSIQQAVQKHLTPEQQGQFEEELNRGFRDWLVTSGNLRQVLDLVHLERRGQVG